MQDLASKIKDHQSLADWEFAPDHVHSISGEKSYKGDKSLKSEGAPGAGPILAIYPLDILTVNMSFGYMSTAFLWSPYYSYCGFIMRSQSHPGDCDMNNCYLIWFSWNRIRFGIMRDGTWYPINEMPWDLDKGLWHEFKVYWQTQLQPDGTSPFQAILYEIPYTGPEHYVATFKHPWDEYACSGLNRPGIMLNRDQVTPVFIDYTWIYHKPRQPEYYLGLPIKTLHPTLVREEETI